MPKKKQNQNKILPKLIKCSKMVSNWDPQCLSERTNVNPGSDIFQKIFFNVSNCYIWLNSNIIYYVAEDDLNLLKLPSACIENFNRIKPRIKFADSFGPLNCHSYVKRPLMILPAAFTVTKFASAVRPQNWLISFLTMRKKDG